MVTVNRGLYKLKRGIVEKIEDRRKAEDEGVKRRLMTVQQQREIIVRLMGMFI